jgi:hypothetical protein
VKDSKGKEIKLGHPQWTLTMERERRGLISRSQFRKRFSKEEQKKLSNKEVRFPWGNGEARGYKV